MKDTVRAKGGETPCWAGWTASRRAFTSEPQSWIGAEANVGTLGECVKEGREARPHPMRHQGGGMCGMRAGLLQHSWLLAGRLPLCCRCTRQIRQIRGPGKKMFFESALYRQFTEAVYWGVITLSTEGCEGELVTVLWEERLGKGSLLSMGDG